jgi:hypothetical protein
VATSAGAPVAFVDTLPAPIGTTPFRVKGHVYKKMRDNVEATVPGGLVRFAERLEDPALRAFFAEPFFAGSWYDALPLSPFAITHARLLGVPLHYHCRERGRIVAGHDVPGVYRALLKLFSPTTLVGRLPRAASYYFDFGDVSLEWVAPNVARTSLSGLPFSLAIMLAGIVEGFMAMALELSGAKGVQVRTLEAVYDGGEIARVPTALVRHEASWSS